MLLRLAVEEGDGFEIAIPRSWSVSFVKCGKETNLSRKKAWHFSALCFNVPNI